MKYRSDIDGLRAVAVISVILFHSDLGLVSGGYIGVDIFFVISGYLITTLIYKDLKEGVFTFKSFYKRRAARLLPALSVTLLSVLIFGFLFYNNLAFDNLGKELFFSSFGAANILFAQGVNYFAADEAYQPLIHLWSLGVEEQFYLIWPLLLLCIFRVSIKIILPVIGTFFLISLWLSITATNSGLTAGYFLPQYRVFELIVGVFTALFLLNPTKYKISDPTKKILSFIGLALVFIPMIALDKESSFPGLNALWPCIGTALIIASPNNGITTKLLAQRPLVFIGLISYPLYLYHQPIISFISFFGLGLPPLGTFALVTSIAIPASWITYRFVESPIRRIVNYGHRKESLTMIALLTLTIPTFAALGIGIAKSNGFEARFKYLNPFALEVSQAHSITFHHHFKRGYSVTPTKHSAVLFVGDSVLQHYVLPMQIALGISPNQIDTVTRGGCVLLKNTNFKDIFSDVSCNSIRDKLYEKVKTYDYVIISQAWGIYDASVLNFPAVSSNKYERWRPLLDTTVEHFLHLSKNIIIIGAHPNIEGGLKLQPSITINKNNFLSQLPQLKINNLNDLKASHSFFNDYQKQNNVIVIEPYNIFCEKGCVATDGQWSYFSDKQHLSTAATTFVADRLAKLISPNGP